MSLPVAPYNGQIAVLGNVSYQFDSAKSAWKRIIPAFTDLSNIGNVYVSNTVVTTNLTVTSITYPNGSPYLSSSSYGNTQVAAYLGPYYTYANANAATQTVAINSINANLGAYQTYANTTVSAIDANLGAYQTYANTTDSTINANLGAYQTYANTTFGTINANLGAYQTYANTTFGTINANLGAYQTYANTTDSTINANLGAYQTYANTTFGTINANLGAYQTYANANAASQATSINTINANLGAYQTYANANAASQATSINTINANLGAFQTYANTTFGASYGNTQVAAYLTGNITTGNISAAGYYFANGTPFTSSNYGNTDVAAYLPIYSGDLNPANITATGNITGGGVKTTTGSSEPANPVPGDMWFDTGTDRLFRYTNLGSTNYWLDIAGQSLSLGSTIGSTYGNSQVSAYLTVTYPITNDGALRIGTTTGPDVYVDALNNIYVGRGGAGSSTVILGGPVAFSSNATFSSGANITIQSGAGLRLASGAVMIAESAAFSGNVATGNVSATGYYFANGAPFTSSNYGNTQVAAYITSTYPIANDGALRIGTTTGPDVYVDGTNNVYLGHGGTNFSTVNVQGRSTFSSNATFTANATISGSANLTINSGSNITVKSGASIHLETGAYIYGDGSTLSNVASGGASAAVAAGYAMIFGGF